MNRAAVMSRDIQDHELLISSVSDIISDPCFGFQKCETPSDGSGWNCTDQPGKRKRSNLVLADDTGIELGPPSEKSASAFLWTTRRGVVPDGIWIAGNDFSRMQGRSVPFAQLVMVELVPDADPMEPGMRTLMNMTNRVAGYMTRSMPGRIWIRVHKDLIQEGFSLEDAGNLILRAYNESPHKGIMRIAVVIVADHQELVSRFEKIVAMARVINGENEKLRWQDDGLFACDELNCDSCGEREFCSLLRELIVKRGNKP